jgi:acyl-CoA thioesterase FadM
VTKTSLSHQIQVRWPDIDGLGHVNHSTILAYLEVGRDSILAAHGISGSDYVVRRGEIDYLGELRPNGGFAEYRLDELELGRTSLRLRERMLQGSGETAVSALFILVLWDIDKRAARELSASERTNLGDLASKLSPVSGSE